MTGGEVHHALKSRWRYTLGYGWTSIAYDGTMKLAIAFVFLWAPLAAQIHVGVKAGVPLTDVTETIGGGAVLRNLPSRWTLGPMVELDLPLGFGVEVDALYRRVGYEGPAGRGPLAGEVGEFKDGLWDFPVIAKYKFPGAVGRPYIGGGWTYRRLNELLRFTSSSNGFVLAAGVRINAPALKISPEVRYTRWANDDIQPGFRTNRNQTEILVGITF